MKQNFWTWWAFKPTESELKKYVNELYMDVNWMWGAVDHISETKDYVKLCKDLGVKLYFRVPCFASAFYQESGLSKEDVKKDIKQWIRDFRKLGVHIALDYIRNNPLCGIYKPTREDIREIVDYAYSKDKDTIVALFPKYISWYYNQYYSDFKKLRIMPMIYGTNFWTYISLIWHKWMGYEPCIKGWNIELDEFKFQASLLEPKKYSIWRWNHWKENIKE